MPTTTLVTVTLLVLATSAPAPQLSVPDLAERTVGSVALIATTDAHGKALATGSGVFLTADGLLVTNHHVVSGASAAIAKLPNGAFYVIKGFLAVDKRNDLVLLQVDGTGFKPVELGASTSLRLGQEVVAIGSPLAFEGTVSTGIVSGFRTDLEVERAIQTTAPISPGSSGGALLDLKGRVVGLTTLQATKGQNLNFAVASELIQRLLSQNRELRQLDDLRERLNLAVFLNGTAQTWTHTLDGSEWSIRRVGNTIYAQMIMPTTWRELGLYHSCEYQYSLDDDAWWGVCKSRVPMSCQYVRTCEIEVFDSLTEMTPQRLSGLSPKLEDISCQDCRLKVSEDLFPFSLVPGSSGSLAYPPTREVLQPASPPAPKLPIAASIDGKITSQTETTTSFSWTLQLTSTTRRIADAEIQFLDARGFVVATAHEKGLQLAAGTPSSFRGTTELSSVVAARVVRLGVKVTAR
jgi:trypsin-like peptidase